MKSQDTDPYSLPEERTTPWETPSAGDIEALIAELGKQLDNEFGDRWRKSRVTEVPHDELSDVEYGKHLSKIFNLYIKACGQLNFNWHNPGYMECFSILKQEGV